MAAIDYAAITRQLAQILNEDSDIEGTRVFVEEMPQIGLMDAGVAIALYLLGRQPHPQQVAAAGKRTRFIVRISVVCLGFDAGSFLEAEQKRDDLIGKVELVLMRNRTINGKVAASWLEGGDFASAQAPGGAPFVAAGEINLMAEVSAINT